MKNLRILLSVAALTVAGAAAWATSSAVTTYSVAIVGVTPPCSVIGTCDDTKVNESCVAPSGQAARFKLAGTSCPNPVAAGRYIPL